MFVNTSTAGSAAITNNNLLLFNETSTAGSATITTNAGGSTRFSNTSSGGNARFITNASGAFDISGLAAAAMAAGSIEGAGSYHLGSKQLTVGSNGLSTTVSGAISDGGNSGGTGGALVKTGTGTLTLSGTNTYTGGTAINAGVLQLGNGGATGSIRGAVTVGGSGTFEIVNADTSGITSISNAGATNFRNGTSAGSAGITNNLFLNFNNTSTAGSATITNNSSLLFLDTSTAGSAAIANNNGVLNFYNASTAGSATIINRSSLTFNDTSTAGSAGITNNLFLSFGNTSTAGNATIVNTISGLMGFSATSSAGSATITNNNILSFAGTAGSATITTNAGGSTQFYGTGTAGSATIVTNAGGFTQFFGTSTAGSATIATNAGGFTQFFGTSSGGSARFITNASGALDISSLWAAAAGMTAGSIEGAGVYYLGSKQLTVGGNSLNTTVSGVISDCGSGTDCQTRGATGGSLMKTGAGTLTLSGTNTYTGATTVNAGILSVSGSILNSNVTVNAGGTLGGNGTVGNTTINGGALLAGTVGAPGTLNVNGSLMMTSAAAYVVFGNAAAIGKTVVTGTAGIGGTATINLASTGGYHAGSFAILVANGGLTGTFSTVNVLGTLGPLVRNPHLMYDAHDVFLVLDPGTISPLLPANASANARALAAGFDAAILSGANPGGGFNALLNLTGVALTGALSQASGETAAGSQQTTFGAMTQFMGLLLDPFLDGRGEPVSPSSGASQFAEEESSTLAYASYGKPRSKSERDAYAAIYRKAPLAQTYDPRWSVWAAGFGGSQTTDGNVALGSNSATSRIAGTAVGADYRFSPFTIAGFALAGGGTNFSLANALGSGRSDLFQAGAFVKHNVGAAYITGALAYGWQNVTTDRTVTIAGVDRLRAEFNANAFSGRVEGGYRFVTPWIGGLGITPYAAGQFTTFDLPAYAEQVLSGANTFALAYASKSVTASRSELGLRTDKSYAMQNAILTLRGRAAWAHDFNPDRSIAATFQTLPGASFVVNGAAQAKDAALATASAEMKWRNGWSAAATFEGEFSSLTKSYAGKGVVRYSW
jgi:autotransporter-associated beta strand protein